MKYSNCLIEALKAKLKDWRHIRLIVIGKGLQTRSHHFAWTDGEYYYHSYSQNPKWWTRYWYKPTIRKVPWITFESWVCDRLKGQERSLQLKVLKKLGIHLADIPNTDGKEYFVVCTAGDLPKEEDVRYMEKLFRGKVFIKIVQEEKEMKVLTYEQFWKSKFVKSDMCYSWRYVTPMDSPDYEALYGDWIRVKLREITDEIVDPPLYTLDWTFDQHVHIRQWKDRYFSAPEVFSKLKSGYGKGCVFMSTTSCMPVHPNNKEEILALYEKVRDEVKDALQIAKDLKFKAKPYYWVVPLFHLNGISLNQVFKDVPKYRGLKIHPKSHNWNPKDKERANLLTQVFEFAEKRNLPIILHTGNSKEDNPRLYEKWFKDFPNVKVTLAHCKNLKAVKYLFRKYPQLNGDTAMIPKENEAYLNKHGFARRLVYGSDFPICDLFEGK